MLVLPILGSLGFSQSQFLMIKLGSRMRSACIAAVYRKSLNLHSIQSTEAEVKDFLAKKLLAGTSGDTGGGKGEGGKGGSGGKGGKGASPAPVLTLLALLEGEGTEIRINPSTVGAAIEDASRVELESAQKELGHYLAELAEQGRGRGEDSKRAGIGTGAGKGGRGPGGGSDPPLSPLSEAEASVAVVELALHERQSFPTDESSPALLDVSTPSALTTGCKTASFPEMEAAMQQIRSRKQASAEDPAELARLSAAFVALEAGARKRRSESRSSQGKIVNLMSNDANSFVDRLQMMPGVFVIPVQICLIFAVLYYIIGVYSLVGMLYVGCCLPLMFYAVAQIQRNRQKMLQATDRRIGLVSELLSSIRAIKVYSWEAAFNQGATNAREAELVLLERMALLMTCFMPTVVLSIPMVTPMLVLTVYTADGNVLRASDAISVLMLFVILRIPLGAIPRMAGQLVQLSVSLQRIRSFLQLPEVRAGVVRTQGVEAGVVRVRQGLFDWSIPEGDERNTAQDAESTLEAAEAEPSTGGPQVYPPEPIPDQAEGSGGDLLWKRLELGELTIAPGELLAVVGTVGSGKSTLLSALLGNLNLLGGEVAVGGRVAYCAQQPWIQNATIRDNITFGQPYDQALLTPTPPHCSALLTPAPPLRAGLLSRCDCSVCFGRGSRSPSRG